MKKLILALTTVAFIGIGGSAVSAQAPPTLPGSPDPLPTECSESDQKGPDTDGDGIPDDCVQFYFEEDIIVLPPVTTTTVPVTVPPQDLPRTGSGVSPILSIGALLLIGGGIVVVASRRRSSAAPTT